MRFSLIRITNVWSRFLRNTTLLALNSWNFICCSIFRKASFMWLFFFLFLPFGLIPFSSICFLNATNFIWRSIKARSIPSMFPGILKYSMSESIFVSTNFCYSAISHYRVFFTAFLISSLFLELIVLWFLISSYS